MTGLLRGSLAVLLAAVLLLCGEQGTVAFAARGALVSPAFPVLLEGRSLSRVVPAGSPVAVELRSTGAPTALRFSVRNALDLSFLVRNQPCSEQQLQPVAQTQHFRWTPPAGTASGVYDLLLHPEQGRSLVFRFVLAATDSTAPTLALLYTEAAVPAPAELLERFASEPGAPASSRAPAKARLHVGGPQWTSHGDIEWCQELLGHLVWLRYQVGAPPPVCVSLGELAQGRALPDSVRTIAAVGQMPVLPAEAVNALAQWREQQRRLVVLSGEFGWFTAEADGSLTSNIRRWCTEPGEKPSERHWSPDTLLDAAVPLRRHLDWAVGYPFAGLGPEYVPLDRINEELPVTPFALLDLPGWDLLRAQANGYYGTERNQARSAPVMWWEEGQRLLFVAGIADWSWLLLTAHPVLEPLSRRMLDLPTFAAREPFTVPITERFYGGFGFSLLSTNLLGVLVAWAYQPPGGDALYRQAGVRIGEKDLGFRLTDRGDGMDALAGDGFLQNMAFAPPARMTAEWRPTFLFDKPEAHPDLQLSLTVPHSSTSGIEPLTTSQIFPLEYEPTGNEYLPYPEIDLQMAGQYHRVMGRSPAILLGGVHAVGERQYVVEVAGYHPDGLHEVAEVTLWSGPERLITLQDDGLGADMLPADGVWSAAFQVSPAVRAGKYPLTVTIQDRQKRQGDPWPAVVIHPNLRFDLPLDEVLPHLEGHIDGGTREQLPLGVALRQAVAGWGAALLAGLAGMLVYAAWLAAWLRHNSQKHETRP